jgi:hypothetical protein
VCVSVCLCVFFRSSGAFYSCCRFPAPPSILITHTLQAESRAGSLITAEIAPQLAAEAWKERLEGTTALCTALEARDDLDAGDVLAVVLVLEARTKGWKDSNFQVRCSVAWVYARVGVSVRVCE